MNKFSCTAEYAIFRIISILKIGIPIWESLFVFFKKLFWNFSENQGEPIENFVLMHTLLIAETVFVFEFSKD